MTLYDIVKKLAGPIDAVGETNADTQRLENLKATIELVDRLVFDIAVSAKSKDRKEASMEKIGGKAYEFLLLLKESLDDEPLTTPASDDSSTIRS